MKEYTRGKRQVFTPQANLSVLYTHANHMEKTIVPNCQWFNNVKQSLIDELCIMYKFAIESTSKVMPAILN